MIDPLGRQTRDGRLGSDHDNGPRALAIADFMFVMQYRRDLTEARALIAAAYNETAAARIDPDIAQAEVALKDAALVLEASRP